MGNTERAIDSQPEKIRAWLCRAGAGCYSLDQLCVVPRSKVIVLPRYLAARALYFHTKWGHPRCCSTPYGATARPALASQLPAPCRCLHRRQSNLLWCVGLSCPRRARACCSLGACPEPAKKPVPVCPAPCPLVLFSNSALGEDQQEHALLPTGCCSLPAAGAVPTARV